MSFSPILVSFPCSVSFWVLEFLAVINVLSQLILPLKQIKCLLHNDVLRINRSNAYQKILWGEKEDMLKKDKYKTETQKKRWV